MTKPQKIHVLHRTYAGCYLHFVEFILHECELPELASLHELISQELGLPYVSLNHLFPDKSYPPPPP
jgi:hypothetical protein